MDKYLCLACGYIYNPEEGDPASGIEPGTALKLFFILNFLGNNSFEKWGFKLNA